MRGDNTLKKIDVVNANNIDQVLAEIHKEPPSGTETPFSTWMEKLVLTDEEAEKISNPDWIYENLIISGHLIVIPAPPNGGKTTIMFDICCELAQKGQRVYYVNADISGVDAKEMIEEANRCGVLLQLPDFKGSSMSLYVDGLKTFIESGEVFTGMLIVFDTLKKMTDVIAKSKAKELYSMLRIMTARGATIVLLAHTNKYTDSEGKPIFEGTSDLRSDVDEMIYLVPVKHDDGSMTVSTKPDKVRGRFEPITFKIDADRNVTRIDYINTTKQSQIIQRLNQDEDRITAVNQAIAEDIHKQEEIVTFCKENHHIGARTTRRVLKDHSGKSEYAVWHLERGYQNSKRYYMQGGV